MTHAFCRVPPSPEVMRDLFEDYKATGLTEKITFTEYLRIIEYTDPSVNRDGMDDGMLGRAGPQVGGPQLFVIPQVKVTGKLRVIVLLVDFADRQGIRPREDYEALLFSKGTYPTGSMADFYEEASEKHVQIEGSVHGWFRLPRPYSSYTNNESGMGNNTSTSYPDNAQAMAEDAVRAALAANVPFPQELDALNQGLVTALFLVHAGPGAEVMPQGACNQAPFRANWFRNLPGSQAFGRFTPSGQSCITTPPANAPVAADYSLQLAATVSRSLTMPATFNPCTWDTVHPLAAAAPVSAAAPSSNVAPVFEVTRDP